MAALHTNLPNIPSGSTFNIDFTDDKCRPVLTKNACSNDGKGGAKEETAAKVEGNAGDNRKEGHGVQLQVSFGPSSRRDTRPSSSSSQQLGYADKSVSFQQRIPEMSLYR